MFQDKQISRFAMILVAAGLLGATGCASETADDQAEAAAASEGEAPAEMGQTQSPHGQVSVVMYRCAEEKSFALTVAPGVGQAALRVDGEVFQLDQQEVASGMEYSDGSYTFRGKGTEADVEKDGEPLFVDCVAAGHPE